MNRRHRVADYLDIVARVRAARPDIALSSDFIVGYPGETDADFEQTLALVRAVGFASSYAFKYSPRPGTPAAEMAGQVDEAVKARAPRRASGAPRGAAAGLQPGAASAGASRSCSRSPAAIAGQIIGRSPYMQSVFAEGPRSLIGAHGGGRDRRRRPQFACAGELSRQRRKPRL